MDGETASIVEVPNESAGESAGQDELEGSVGESEASLVRSDVDDEDSSGGGHVQEGEGLGSREGSGVNIPDVVVVARNGSGGLEDKLVRVEVVLVDLSVGGVVSEGSREAVEPGEGRGEVNNASLSSDATSSQRSRDTSTDGGVSTVDNVTNADVSRVEVQVSSSDQSVLVVRSTEAGTVEVFVQSQGFSEGVLSESHITSSSESGSDIGVDTSEGTRDKDLVVRSNEERLGEACGWGVGGRGRGRNVARAVRVASLLAVLGARVAGGENVSVSSASSTVIAEASLVADATAGSANTSSARLGAGSDDLARVTRVVGSRGGSGTVASEGGLVASTSAVAVGILAVSGDFGNGDLSGLGGGGLEDDIVVVSVGVLEWGNIFNSDNVLVLKAGDQDVDFSSSFLLVESFLGVEGGLRFGADSVGVAEPADALSLGEWTNSGGDAWLQASRVVLVVRAGVREGDIVVENDFLVDLSVSLVVDGVGEVTELVSVTSAFPKDGDVDVSFSEAGGVSEVEEEVGVPGLGGEEGRGDGLSFRKEGLDGGDEVGRELDHISVGWVMVTYWEWWCRSVGANDT